MTFDDLSRTLHQAMRTEKIGTPVSVRLHLQLCDPQADLTASTVALLILIEPYFDLSSPQLLARRGPADSQLTVLLETAQGRTVFITVGRGSAQQPSLHLLLIGNHGVIRLEETQSFEESPLPTTTSMHAERYAEWNIRIAQSIAENCSKNDL